MSGHKKWKDIKNDREISFSYLKEEVALEDLSVEDYWKIDIKNLEKKDRKRFKEERVKFGYATEDWWSFDTYLAGVIAHGLNRFYVEAHGHPGDKTMEEWKDELKEIAEPLAKWASHDRWLLSFEDENKLYEQVQESVRKLADIFGHLWD